MTSSSSGYSPEAPPPNIINISSCAGFSAEHSGEILNYSKWYRNLSLIPRTAQEACCTYKAAGPQRTCNETHLGTSRKLTSSLCHRSASLSFSCPSMPHLGRRGRGPAFWPPLSVLVHPSAPLLHLSPMANGTHTAKISTWAKQVTVTFSCTRWLKQSSPGQHTHVCQIPKPCED